MRHHWEENSKNRVVEYQWKKNKAWQSFKVCAALTATEIEKDSETEFITEHYWGYAKVNDNISNEYEVTHPRWKEYKVESSEINVDFGVVYGKSFEFLNDLKPTSIMLAEGSEITVEGKNKIREK
tara:strand:- start:325 stop:699 length:375 start_codon:yes stop_codon:yes gene_type:complete